MLFLISLAIPSMDISHNSMNMIAVTTTMTIMVPGIPITVLKRKNTRPAINPPPLWFLYPSMYMLFTDSKSLADNI